MDELAKTMRSSEFFKSPGEKSSSGDETGSGEAEGGHEVIEAGSGNKPEEVDSGDEVEGGDEDEAEGGDEVEFGDEAEGGDEDEAEGNDEDGHEDEAEDGEESEDMPEELLTFDEDTHTSSSIFERDFIRGTSHGHGSFGQITVCTHRIDKNTYAVKRFSAQDDKQMPFEIFALSRLYNKYIVRFHQVWKEPFVRFDCTSSSEENSKVAVDRTNKSDCYYILMEFCPRTLADIWDKNGKVDVQKAWDILTQLAEGISFIHDNGYIHCDMNPKNVLLDEKGTVKICDFGMGRFQEGKKEQGVFVMDFDPDELANLVYRAPEFKKKEPLTEKVDIYSLAVIAIDLFHATEMERVIKREAFIHKKEVPDILASIKDLLIGMVDGNPDCRPSAEKVLSVLAQKKYELFEGVQPPKSVQPPVVILVRATRFIVNAVSLPLLKAGCKVLVNLRTEFNQLDMEEISNEVTLHGGIIFVNDLLRENDVQAMIKMAVDAWGNVDILINNAGDKCASMLDLSDLSDRVSFCIEEIMKKK